MKRNKDQQRVVRSFRIDRVLLGEVDKYCEDNCIDRTTLITRLLRKELDKINHKEE